MDHLVGQFNVSRQVVGEGALNFKEEESISVKNSNLLLLLFTFTTRAQDLKLFQTNKQTKKRVLNNLLNSIRTNFCNSKSELAGVGQLINMIHYFHFAFFRTSSTHAFGAVCFLKQINCKRLFSKCDSECNNFDVCQNLFVINLVHLDFKLLLFVNRFLYLSPTTRTAMCVYKNHTQLTVKKKFKFNYLGRKES